MAFYKLRKVRNPTAQTTDAVTPVVVVAAVIQVNQNPAVRVKATLLGKRSGNGDSVCMHLTGSAQCPSSVLAVNAYTFDVDGDSDLVSSTAELTSTSATIQLKVYGVAAQTIDWIGVMEIEEFAP